MPTFTLALYLTIASIGAFNGGVWGVAGIGGAIILFAGTWIIDRRLPMPDPRFAALALVTLIVMALLSLHSSQPDISWFECRRLTGVFLPLLLLSCPSILPHIRHPKLFRWLPLAAFVGASALGFELSMGGILLRTFKGIHAELTEYNRGLSYLVILAFPIMAGLWVTGLRRYIIPFILVLLIPASLTDSRAAKLALMVGMAVTICAWFRPRIAQGGMTVLVPLLIGWPFAAQQFFRWHENLLQRFPPSWHERIEIWDALSYRIMERPLLGWGPGVTRAIDIQTPHGAHYVFLKLPPPHAHNVVTQLWVEMGLPGLALGLVFALLTLRVLSKLDAELRPFALGAWAAGLCLSLVAYNFWTDSLFAAFALTGLAFGVLRVRMQPT